jgi:hypothetical protein
LKKTDLKFWDELTATIVPAPTNTDNTYAEDDGDEPDTGFEDDSDLPCEAVMVHIVNSILPDRVAATTDGDLVSTAEAESMENVEESESDKLDDLPVVEELGPGKRKRRANTLYEASTFWRHHDEEASDEEGY